MWRGVSIRIRRWKKPSRKPRWRLINKRYISDLDDRDAYEWITSGRRNLRNGGGGFSLAVARLRSEEEQAAEELQDVLEPKPVGQAAHRGAPARGHEPHARPG